MPVTRHSKSLRVDIGVMPLREPGPAAGMLMVTFGARPAPSQPIAVPSESDEHALHLLEDELQVTRRDLQGAIEQMEARTRS